MKKRTPAHLLGLGLLCATLTPPVAASRLETDPCIPTINRVCEEMTRDLEVRKERLQAELEAALELQRATEREPPRLELHALCPEGAEPHEEFWDKSSMGIIDRELIHTCKRPDGTLHGLYRHYNFNTGVLEAEGFVWEGQFQWSLSRSLDETRRPYVHHAAFYKENREEGIQWSYSESGEIFMKAFRGGEPLKAKRLDPEGPL